MTLINPPAGGPRGDSLEKLTIFYRKDGVEPAFVEALFNPAEISRSRTIEWEKPVAGLIAKVPYQPRRDFIAVRPETLSVSLFFDTCESRADADSRVAGMLTNLAAPGSPFDSGTASDVTRLTRRVVELAQVDRETHEPPVCQLSWGRYAHIFTGVLTQLDQRFTMFLPDGTPVRATLDCTFAESPTLAAARAGELHSADVVKSRVVRRGDTLHSIAAREYGDPALWKEIARANGITNPLRVSPGTVLTIPRLDG